MQPVTEERHARKKKLDSDQFRVASDAVATRTTTVLSGTQLENLSSAKGCDIRPDLYQAIGRTENTTMRKVSS
jgi:hypothetical protein